MRAVVLLSCLAACGRVGFSDRPDPDASSDAMGISERAIDIAGSLIASSLTDFPLYVHLDPAPTGTLEFLDANDQTLPFERETATDYWVRVAIAGNTTIRARYGDLAVAALDPTTVWDSHYVGVWHLSDAHDSTANHNNGVFTGVTATTGVVGGAQTMTQGWMIVPNSASVSSLTSVDGLTLETWANVATVPPLEYTLIARQTDGTTNDDFRLAVSSTPKIHSEFTLDPGQNNLAFDLGITPIAVWELLTVSRIDESGTVQHTLNGVTVGLGTASGTLHSDTNPLVFGADCNNCGATPNDDFYNGALDEARVSNIVRSLDWIRAEYLNVSGQLVTVH